MAETHEMVAGDLTPELTVTLLKPDERTPIDGLTAETEVKFVLKAAHDAAAVISYQDAVVIDATNAKVKYSWQAGDTDTNGRFLGRFRIKISGKFQHFPNKKWIVVNFNEA